MAIVTNNLITQGMRGKLGNIVFRTRNGKTYASAAPSVDRTRKPTPRQVKIQAKFSECVKHASKVRNDPRLYKLYSDKLKPGQTVYGEAFKDAYHGRSKRLL